MNEALEKIKAALSLSLSLTQLKLEHTYISNWIFMMDKMSWLFFVC